MVHSMEEKEDKVVIKLTKHPLESERKEIAARKRRRALVVVFCILFLILGLLGGYLIAGLTNSYLYQDEHSRFDKIIEIMKNNWLYSDQYEDLEKELEDKAYYGMLAFEEDPYTTYMSSEDLENFSSSINQDYVGIGVMYTSYNDIPQITRVYNNTPAEKAGLRVGDIIIKVDDIEIDETNIDSIKEYVIGEEGSVVKITVLRDAKEVSFPVTRGAVDTSSYGYETDEYAYLEIASFGENTAHRVEAYLKSFKNKKLIIDLRNDTGGYQDAVQVIAGLFIGPDEIYMRQEYPDDKSVVDHTPSDVKKYSFDKIVILTNGETASASEVLAICLKESLDNVTLVGETTYGKGVVQSTVMIEDDSAMKYTTSRWLSPINKVWVNGEGIKPDIEVKQDEVFYEYALDMEEDEEYRYDQCSSQIKIAEMCLDYLDYDVDREDGYMSEKAIKAVVEFKKDHGIEETEVLDFKTYVAILSETSYIGSSDKEKDNQLQKAIEVLNK